MKKGTVARFAWGKKGTREAVVRYTRKKDYPGVLKVDKDRARYRHKVYKVPKRKRKDIGDRSSFLKSFSNPDQLGFLVLEIGNEIAGYIAVGKTREYSPPATKVYTLSVREKFHRNGFGETLLRYAIEEVRRLFPKSRRLALNVHQPNKPAINLYKKVGFKQQGRPWLRLNTQLWNGKPVRMITMVLPLQ